MADSAHHTIRRAAAARPRGWCCSFAGVPESPEHRGLPASTAVGAVRKLLPSPPPPKSPLAPSSHSSPSSKLAGLIDPRRILSPGRVSPIDSEGSPAVAAAEGPSREEQAAPFVALREDDDDDDEDGEGRWLDLRLCLRGRDGRCVAMELDSAVLRGSSAFFAGIVPDASGRGAGAKRVEVDGVDNLEAFKEAVELMFEPHPMRWLARAGVSRAIAVLEVRREYETHASLSFHFIYLLLVCADNTARLKKMISLRR